MEEISKLTLTDDTAEGFTETIEKLETFSVSSPLALRKRQRNNSICRKPNCNPFQLNVQNKITVDDLGIQLFGPKCNCDSNVMCQSRLSPKWTITRGITGDKSSEHIIHNPTKFKSKSKRKSILREPVLKYISECTHNHRSNCLTQSRITKDLDDSDDDNECECDDEISNLATQLTSESFESNDDCQLDTELSTNEQIPGGSSSTYHT